MKNSKKARLFAVSGALAILLSACGSPAATTSTTAQSATSTTVTPETINVGVLPIADVAPLYVGIKEGFFAKQNLTVNPQVLQGGAAVVSAVVGGSLNFGFGATANLILAKSHQLPIQFVAQGDQAAASASAAWSGIMVEASSGINSVADLAGKTIASNALQGENELALDSVLEANGVNPSSVHVVAMPFPSMPAALAAGQVQAATVVEPFVSAIEAHGGKMLSPLFEGMAPNLLVAGYFTTSSVIDTNPSLVKRFQTAINESLSFSAANPDVVRNVIPTYTSISAANAATLKLPVWSPNLNSSTIAAQAALMVKLGWISTAPTLNQLIWSGATK